MSLFRPEALDWLENSQHGESLSIREFAFGWLTLGALAIPGIVLAFLYFAHYAKTERAVGVLLPKSGLTQIVAPRLGTVEQSFVKEGELVAVGAPLLHIRTAGQELAGGGGAARLVIEELERSLQRADQQRARRVELDATERGQLAREIVSLRQQLAELTARVEHQGARVKLLRAQVARRKKLSDEGIYAEATVDYERLQLRAAQEQQAALRAQRSQLAAQLEARETDAEAQPTRQRYRLSQLDEEVATLRRQLVQHRTEEGYTLTAPVAGRVATLRVSVGETVTTTEPLLTIVPPQSELQAELYVPTDARGSLRIGQEVLLQYRAFPPREYGAQKGEVIEISATTVLPGELRVPLPQPEPVYRVRVALENQRVTVRGVEKPLQPEMLLDAELVSERRRVIAWLFGPLLNARDRS